LEANGFNVHSPAMPDTQNPVIENWVAHLSDIVGTPTQNDYFIGFSLGCQVILRYLESRPENTKAKGVFFMAGFIHLINLSSEERSALKQWLETPIDLSKAKNRCDKFVAVFSDNDPIVPLSDMDIFEKELGAKIIIKKDKGHFDNEPTVPYLFKEIQNN
jgi:predicted alpha/beta hydrolase family esterase